jgi:ATP-binding cassette subfamily F protein uup
MNVLTAENLTKAYSERVLLDHVSFSLQAGEKVGVIGINGMGKSTLLRIVAGAEEPDEGVVITGNSIRIGYLPQEPEFGETETVLSAALCGALRNREDFGKESEAKSMLMKLDFTDLDQPVRELSGGQKKRVALAHVLLQPADILVLDEPTNHLDSAMSGWLEEWLLRFRGTLLMVTHDRYFLDRVSSRIVEVDRGAIYSYPGSYSEYVRLKEERLDMEKASERKRQSILRTELQWLARGARARSTKQKAHIQRIERLQKTEAPAEQKQVEMSSLSSRMGRKTLEASEICKSFGDRILIDHFSYLFLKNDRIGIIGPNGCGKTTLLKILTGKAEPDSGEVSAGTTIKTGYFSQENEYMDLSQRAIEYIRDVAEYVETAEGKITASALMERFLFDGTQQWTRIEKLSGGEKRRLQLLHVLMGAPNVLVLDEPTNDLDIRTLTILEDYLDSFSGIVVVVSHDRYFLDRTVRRIFAFEENGKLRQYEGGYSDYLAAREQREAARQEKQAGSEKKEAMAGRDAAGGNAVRGKTCHEEKLKFSYKEQREFETIDQEIEELEKRIAFLDQEMENASSQYARLTELTAQKDETQQELDRKMERWVYLSELAEKIEAQR